MSAAAPAVRRRPALRHKLVLAAAGLVVGFVLAECAFRAFAPPPANAGRGGYFLSESGRVVPLGEIVHFLTHVDEYEDRNAAAAAGTRPSGGLRKNLKLRMGYDPPPRWDYFDGNGTISVATNSLGFRDLEFAVQKQPDEFRVLAFGDSFTYGSGVRLDLAWPQVLEERLRRELGRPVEVVNCGYATGRNVHSPDGYDRWLASDGLLLDPDLVLLGICLNDLGTAVPMLSYPVVPLEPVLGGWSKLLDHLVWSQRQRSARAVQRDLAQIVRDDPAGWNATQRGMLAMRDQLAAAEVPFAVAVFPMLSQLDRYPYRGLHELVVAFCRENGIRCVDLLPWFEGLEDEPLWAHATDQHPNHVGHAIIARVFGDHLAKEGLLPQPRRDGAVNR